MKKLYLVPSAISTDTKCIPCATIDLIKETKYFVCEKVRTTRRFIKAIIPDFSIDNAEFVELEKKGMVRYNLLIINTLIRGVNIVFMSEAGSPCIADPGAELVNIARKYGYTVHPMTGPSSILLALMSSGMDGQHFTFRGYLPVKKQALISELKQIEKTVLRSGYTQIFIETPYRNKGLYETIVSTLSGSMRLNISLGISTDHEFMDTRTISEWQKDPDMTSRLSKKIPCVFLLGI